MGSTHKTTTIQWESRHSLPVGDVGRASYTLDGTTYHLNVTRHPTVDADWMVCGDALSADEIETTVPWERRLLLFFEPKIVGFDLAHYADSFRDQFGVVVSPYACKRTRPSQKVIRRFPLMGPWYGRDHAFYEPYSREGADSDLATALQHCLTEPAVEDKTDTISIINSRICYIPFHAYRNSYVATLAEILDSEADVYGRQHRPVARKAEAISPYRYHVVLENNFDENMWTERLADSFLGLALPLYLGCPNVEQWFHKDAIIRLPDDNPREAANVIRTAVRNGEFERRLPALREARRQILEEYNPYAQVASILGDLSRDRSTINTPKLTQTDRLRKSKRYDDTALYRLRRSLHRRWWRLARHHDWMYKYPPR